MKTRIILSVLFFTSALFFSSQSKAETILGETTIQGEVMWESNGNPYRIQGNITITEGASLTIHSGCRLIFEGKFGIFVAGDLQINAAMFQGMDLGDGKHILWKGIKKSGTEARISLDGLEIQDCEIAVDYSDFPYNGQTAGHPFTATSCHFINNLIALKTGAQGGGNFSCSDVTFTENDIAVLGNFNSIDSLGRHYKLHFWRSKFQLNRVGIQDATFVAEGCQFLDNEEAIRDAFYIEIDSSGFNANKLAISGYGLLIERTVFYNNDKGIVHKGRNLQRDHNLFNSILRSNHFESNKEAFYVEDGAMVEEMSCNLFYKNDIGLALPDSLYNSKNNPYRIEKNVFLENNLAIQILALESVISPANGTALQPAIFVYNALAFNFVILDQTSPNNLNFFHNYILANTLRLIDLGIVDGDDDPKLGLVNYTFSGDTSHVNTLITVNKIKDVIKHGSYDSAFISGESYSFEMCQTIPGNNVGIKPLKEEMHFNAFPNPFSEEIQIEWEEGTAVDFRLFDMKGQEIYMNNSVNLSSPARFDLRHLTPGIYLIRAQTERGVRSFKLIKN